MIQRLMRAQTDDERTLAFLQNLFLLIAAFGLVFYGVEHWVIDHQTLTHWTALIPAWVSIIGTPLAIAMFFSTRKWLTYAFVGGMAVAFLTGLLGALLHLIFNASDLGVSLFSISGFLESMQVPYRPVLAGLAHTHVGAVGLAVGLTAWVKD
ncbi:MAG: hypothetical protein R6T93_13000 [Trueperaceae bacterium]